MHKPWCSLQTIPASGTVVSTGSIPLVRARNLSITARVTFGASVDADATVYLYYSPDGNNWDTIEFTNFAITYTASGTIQRTACIDCPEHGYMLVKITNGSSQDTVTSPKLWYTIQSWGKTGDVGRGATYIDSGEERQMVEEETRHG